MVNNLVNRANKVLMESGKVSNEKHPMLTVANHQGKTFMSTVKVHSIRGGNVVGTINQPPQKTTGTGGAGAGIFGPVTPSIDTSRGGASGTILGPGGIKPTTPVTGGGANSPIVGPGVTKPQSGSYTITMNDGTTRTVKTGLVQGPQQKTTLGGKGGASSAVLGSRR